MHNFEPYWMPFTANSHFKKHPKLLVSAKGMFYQDIDGRDILDGTSGLWCVNAGHNQKKITQAIQSQAERMDYGPSFQLAHPLAFELSNKLAKISPAPLQHVFFSNSGSEAVDTALKIALQYQQARGETQRKVLVGREKDYHGVGFGGISVGGLPNNQRHFPALPHVVHLPHTHNLEHNAFSRGLPDWGEHYALALERIAHDAPNQIAAVIVEPLAGSVGVILPPKGYLRKLRQLCDEIGALLIFDEVITGFGRIGDCFAATHFDVVPDIITCAKGLTNATVPMGAVLVRDDIYQTILESQNARSIEFFHGYTFSGHPLACAAALASLEVYEEQQLYDRAKRLSKTWEEAIHSLKDLPHIIDIRNYGLVAALELQSRVDQPGQRALEVFDRCFADGLLVRVTGDTIALSPPLIIEPKHIEQLVKTLSIAIAGIQ